MSGVLISAAELRSGRPSGTVVLDASYLPHRDPDQDAARFRAAHLPGARRFDLRASASARTDLPNMLPPAPEFAAFVGRLGVGESTPVVVYDTDGIYGAARAWWSLRTSGLPDVRVLDGGLPAWIEVGGPLETGAEPVAESPAWVDVGALLPEPDRLIDRPGVARALADGSAQLVDARTPDRFHAGSIPGAANLAAELVTPKGRLAAEADIRRVLAEAGLEPGRPIIAFCGTGVRASVLALAIERLTGRPAAVYDGSWAEWSAWST